MGESRAVAAMTTRRRTARYAAGFLVLGTSLAGIAVSSCRDDDGCGVEQDPPLGSLDDTPRPGLCASDTLLLTPQRVTLGVGSAASGLADASVSAEAGNTADPDASGDGGNGGSATSGTDEIEMAVEGRRDTGQPHATATVFITALQDSASTGGDDVIKLSPGPGDHSVAQPGQCERVSDARLRCILDADGVARFFARASATASSGQRGLVRAESGSRSATATVQVGASLEVYGGLTVAAGPAALARAASPLECVPAPRSSVPCTMLIARDVTVVVEGGAGGSQAGDASAGDGGDASIAPPPVLVAPLDVTLTVSVSGGADAWLTTGLACSQDHARTLTFLINPLTLGHAPIKLCSDGSPGTARLFARADSARGPVVGQPADEIPLLAMPAIVKVSPDADGGAATSSVLTVADCTGAVIAGARVKVKDQAERTTSPEGTTTVSESVDAGSTQVLLQVENKSVRGDGATCQVTLGGGTP